MNILANSKNTSSNPVIVDVPIKTMGTTVQSAVVKKPLFSYGFDSNTSPRMKNGIKSPKFNLNELTSKKIVFSPTPLKVVVKPMTGPKSLCFKMGQIKHLENNVIKSSFMVPTAHGFKESHIVTPTEITMETKINTAASPTQK